MNIIERTFAEIQTDCCDTEKEADYLKACYERATKAQKEAINRTLIAIYGWSLDSLVEIEQDQ